MSLTVTPPVIPITPQWLPEAMPFATDPHSGAVVEQLTSEPVTSTNIYCEQRFASADGSRIAISRKPFNSDTEIWVCDLRSLRVCRIGMGVALGANPLRNAIYFVRTEPDGVTLRRLDLSELSEQVMHRFAQGEYPGNGAASPEERYFVCGPFPVRDNVMALRRIDLLTGETRTLCEIADMHNPHAQFEPSPGRSLFVQINRGAQWQRSDGGRTLVGKLGATLHTVDIETGQVTPLPVGRPFTPPISGHECWIGQTGRILFTAGQYQVSPSAHVTLRTPPAEEDHHPLAALYSVAPGDESSRVVASGLLFNHVAASDDGLLFIADDHATGVIYVGSIATGKSLPLCNAHARQGTCQHSHIHAYMTPDNRNVIFNSTVTGVAQVFAARVPEGFIERVLAL